MPYSNFPVTPSYDNGSYVEANVNKSQYGESGIVQRENKGINVLKKTWNLNVITTKFQEIETFIDTNLGKPFYLPLDELGNNDGKLYRLLSYKWQYISEDTYMFTSEIKQVYRLK